MIICYNVFVMQFVSVLKCIQVCKRTRRTALRIGNGGQCVLSNQILHKTAQDIREITGFDCAIWDMQGFCLVRTNETLTGYEIQIQDFRDDEEEPEEMILDEMGMFRIYEDSDPVYVLMLHGNADGMELAGRMGASQLRNLLYVYKERMDKNRFIQNLLLDNLLLVDIYNQAKKIKIPAELKRVVFVIEPKNETTVKKFAKQHLTTDTGIEIKIPMEQYNSTDNIEFMTNEDGTISVLIKNIGHITSK